MTPAEYLRTRAKLESDYRAKLRSLDEVWGMQSDDPPPEPIEGHDSAQLQIRGVWRKIARQVIDGMPMGNRFTIVEIEKGVAEISPMTATDRTQISIFLKQLAESKEIGVAEPGGGRRATVFKKTK
ncbi:MAG: hypothetical protein J0M17_24220 [Planctomycetes bacterium]|nr:hypothetical protein [Planctomycetota bacterium]